VALELLLGTLGLTGEVILPSFTFVATAHATLRSGLTPVFVDVDPTTHTLDPAAIRRAITDRTSAILAVHLWGTPGAVDEYEQIADEHGLKLIFDAAHAFCASKSGRKVGNFGAAEVFSFHATKFFTTFEGGAVATNDPHLADALRLARNFGFTGEDSVEAWGTNAKMPEICAAMGLVNLDTLTDVIATNRENYATYRRELADIDGIDLHDVEGSAIETNYQYVVTRVAHGRRDEVLGALRREGVLARRYFWPGAHAMEPYRTLQPRAGETLPATTRLTGEVLVLPTGTAVTVSDVVAVCRIIAAALQRRSS
jgi:dTDP-4-amino-4,6-dideoxygalactose transaminase